MPGWSVFVTAAPSQDYGAQTDEHLITDINKIEVLPSTARMIPCREGIRGPAAWLPPGMLKGPPLDAQTELAEPAPGMAALGATSLNRAPVGSTAVARRPYGVSSAALSVEPPRSPILASEASVSSTPK